MWELSKGWYGDRMRLDYVPKAIEEYQQLLTDVGLTGPFWSLTG